MHRGYIKLWRKSLNSELFANEKLWHIWSWCLMKANRYTQNVFFRTGKNGITIKVKPGEFIFGRHTAAEELNKPGSTVWYNMQKLEQIGAIKIKSDKQYSIICVRNWTDYQGDIEQSIDKQLTGNGQATDTVKKDKKDKKDKNNSIRAAKKSIEYLSDIPEADKKQLAEKFNISTDRVCSEAEAAQDWCRSKGKYRKDYKAFLRNWIRNTMKWDKTDKTKGGGTIL